MKPRETTPVSTGSCVDGCTYQEVEIGEDDADGVLKAGMLVLLPCTACGEPPLEGMQMMHGVVEDVNRALAQVEPFQFLYHWTPTRHRKQIIRKGLIPGRRPVTHPDSVSLSGIGLTVDERWRAPYVCFADCPSWAWALSGLQSTAPSGEWDLWQTSLDRLDDPQMMPSDGRPTGVHEVRTYSRVFKRDLWLIGSRVKD